MKTPAAKKARLATKTATKKRSTSKSAKKAPAKKPPRPIGANKKRTSTPNRRKTPEDKTSYLRIAMNGVSLDRQKEIQNLAIKMRNTPDLTYEGVKCGLAQQRRVQQRIGLIPAYRVTLAKNKDKALVGADESKAKKINGNYERKVARLDAALAAWKTNPYSMRPELLVALNRIRVTKPTSSYMTFARTVRAEIQKENPGADFGQVGQLIGTRWRALTPEQKASYVTPATPSRKAKTVRPTEPAPEAPAAAEPTPAEAPVTTTPEAMVA